MHPGPLDAKSVLVVQDDPFVPIDLEVGLEEAGAHITVANTCRQALRLLQSRAFDRAVLDVRLRDGASYPIARRLRRLGVPFLFVTGCAIVEPAFAETKVLTKPFNSNDMIAALQSPPPGH